MPWTRISGIHRVLGPEPCPGPLYPNILPHRPDTSSPAANRGTLAHLWMATGDRALVEKADWATGAQRRDVLAAIDGLPAEFDRHALWPAEGKVELGAALHIPTGAGGLHQIPPTEKDKWRNSHGSDWLAGSSDYVLPWDPILEAPIVRDLKTGNLDYVTPANKSWQLATYSLCVWAATGRPRGVLGVIDHWHLIPGGYPRQHSSAWFSKEALLRLLTEIQTKHAKYRATPTVSETDLNPTEDNCTFCPVDKTACKFRDGYR